MIMGSMGIGLLMVSDGMNRNIVLILNGMGFSLVWVSDCMISPWSWSVWVLDLFWAQIICLGLVLVDMSLVLVQIIQSALHSSQCPPSHLGLKN